MQYSVACLQAEHEPPYACSLTYRLFVPAYSSNSMGRLNTLVQIYLRQPSRPHITGKRLGLFDTHIWLQHHVCKIVGNATRTLALEAPMESHPDLMYRASTNTQGPHAPCHHGQIGRASCRERV